MRILHIDTGRELRGGQRQALLLFKTMAAAGHQGTLLARPRSSLWLEAESAGISPMPASLLSVWRCSGNFDLVHAHDARAHSWAALATQVPFVVSRRVSFPISRSAASKWKYRRARRFLAISKFVAQQLVTAAIPAQKIDIIYDAVQTEAPAVVWNASLPLVALASYDPLKGRDLIEVASKISGIPVVFSNDLAKDLQNASAFLYISRSEGFGSAALLAMSKGVPLIASRIGGLSEVFEDGISGVAVENDPAEIAKAIRRVVSEPMATLSIISNAQRRVQDHFTVNHLLSRTLASYERALGG